MLKTGATLKRFLFQCMCFGMLFVPTEADWNSFCSNVCIFGCLMFRQRRIGTNFVPIKYLDILVTWRDAVWYAQNGGDIGTKIVPRQCFPKIRQAPGQTPGQDFLEIRQASGQRLTWTCRFFRHNATIFPLAPGYSDFWPVTLPAICSECMIPLSGPPGSK